jgi:hypothetical protein
MDELGDLLKFGDVFVLPDAEITGRDAALGKNRGSLHHYQRSAALGAAAKMNQMPVGCESIVRRVLAHGRNNDTVAEADGTKLQWGKERLAHE